MDYLARITLGLVAGNIGLVVVTIFHVLGTGKLVRQADKQLKQSQMAMQQSQIAMLKGIRYRLEGDVTQIRVMKAQIIPDKAEGMRILEYREKEQLSPTIEKLQKRIEELKKRFKL